MFGLGRVRIMVGIFLEGTGEVLFGVFVGYCQVDISKS